MFGRLARSAPVRLNCLILAQRDRADTKHETYCSGNTRAGGKGLRAARLVSNGSRSYMTVLRLGAGFVPPDGMGEYVC
jgi:hypothetical protein